MADCSIRCITVLIVLDLLCSSIESTPCINGSVKHTLHRSDSSVTRCCKSADCHPGSEGRICDAEFQWATCVECGPNKYNDGTYSTVEIDKTTLCKDQVICDETKGFMPIRPGDSTRKTVCGCMPGQYLILGAVPQECKLCEIGQTLNSDGTGCKPCGNNSYSPGPGVCLNCTQCNDFEEMSQNCTIQHNAVCIPLGPTTESSAEDLTGTTTVKIVFGVIIASVLFYLVFTFINHRCNHSQPRRASGNSHSVSKDDTSASESLLQSNQRDGQLSGSSSPSCPNGAGDSPLIQDPEKCASRQAQSRCRTCWLCFCCPWCCHLCRKTDSSQHGNVNETSHDRQVKRTPNNCSSGACDEKKDDQVPIGENNHNERNSSTVSSVPLSSNDASTSGPVPVSGVNSSLSSDPAATQSTSVTRSNSEFTLANTTSLSASGTGTADSILMSTVTHTDPNTQTVCSPKVGSAVGRTSSLAAETTCSTAGSSCSAATQLSTPAGRSSDAVPEQPSSSDPSSCVLPSDQKKNSQMLVSSPDKDVTHPAIVKSKYEDKLKNCCGDLVRDMEMNEAFLSDMMKNNTLPSNEKRNISQLKKKKEKEQDEAAASKLLDIVLEKGDPAIVLLVESLVRNGEQRLARLIDEELCQQAVKEYTEDLSDFIQVRAELVRRIDITEKLLSHLMRCDVLKTNDKNAILQEKRDATRDTAPGHLLDIVQDKGRRAIQPLVEALVLCDQTDLACMIDPVYAKEYKENRPISGIEFTAQQQHALTESGPSIIQHLDVSEMFLSVMRQENGITQEHCQQIANIQVKQTQNQCFLTILESRPRRSFEQFLKALEETEQTDMLEEIKKYLEEPVGSGHQVTDAELPHNRHAMSQAHDNIEGPLSLRADENETQVKVRNTVENSETRRKEIDNDNDSGTSLKKAARTENASNSIVDKTAVKQYDSENVTGSENYANGTDALTETSVKRL